MNITEHTDLSPFVGQRVTIDGGQAARVQTIHHGTEAVRCADALSDGVWGMCVYEPHGDIRGGASSFWWPYGTSLELETPA